MTSAVGAVQMKPAYAAEPPIASLFSTSTTLAPSEAALAAALSPAIPAPSTSRSITSPLEVMSQLLLQSCLLRLKSVQATAPRQRMQETATSHLQTDTISVHATSSYRSGAGAPGRGSQLPGPGPAGRRGPPPRS